MSTTPPNNGDENLQTSSIPTAGGERSRSSRREARRRKQVRNRWIVTIVIAVLIIVVGVIIAVVLNSSGEDNGGRSDADAPASAEPSRNPSPGLDGIIASNVRPEHLNPGECLTDFTSTEEPATIVECDMPHQAQLVGRQILPAQASYPDPAEAMRTQAEEFCASIQLTGSTEASIVTAVSFPSKSLWEDEGDRRVDCFVVAEDDTVLQNTMIDQPVVENADQVAEEPSDEPADEASAEAEE